MIPDEFRPAKPVEDDHDRLGLNSAPEADDGESEWRRTYLTETAFIATVAIGLVVLVVGFWIFSPTQAPAAPVRTVTPIQVAPEPPPKPYALKRTTLEEAVTNIVAGPGFRIEAYNHAFNNVQFVKDMPATDLPWDEALGNLLAPYNLEYRLENTTVYIGADLSECMRLMNTTSASYVAMWHSNCEELKYKEKHPDPLPTNPFYRCMALNKNKGKGYYENAADCNQPSHPVQDSLPTDPYNRCMALKHITPTGKGFSQDAADCNESLRRPEPLPTDPYYRCMALKHLTPTGKGFLEDVEDCKEEVRRAKN